MLADSESSLTMLGGRVRLGGFAEVPDPDRRVKAGLPEQLQGSWSVLGPVHQGAELPPAEAFGSGISEGVIEKLEGRVRRQVDEPGRS